MAFDIQPLEEYTKAKESSDYFLLKSIKRSTTFDDYAQYAPTFKDRIRIFKNKIQDFFAILKQKLTTWEYFYKQDEY